MLVFLEPATSGHTARVCECASVCGYTTEQEHKLNMSKRIVVLIAVTQRDTMAFLFAAVYECVYMCLVWWGVEVCVCVCVCGRG